MSGIMSLPLLVVMQVCQYFQYLELHGVTHAQFLEQLRAGGGIQGYCGGLPPGVAIACSQTEEEVVENACVALRIALAIGAYGELGDDESVPGATTIVVRVKKVGQGEGLVENFPGVSNSLMIPILPLELMVLKLTGVYFGRHGSENHQCRRPSACTAETPSTRTRTGVSGAGNAYQGQSAQSRERRPGPGTLPAM